MSGTYKEIQKYVIKNYGYVPKNCWIAHVKELSGLKTRKAWNRKSKQRKYPCPPNKIKDIKETLNHFGRLNKAYG